MSIFKTKIPNSVLLDLLDVCEIEKNHYIINKMTFKNIQKNHLPTFLKKCDEYYSKSAKKYLNVSKYKSFLTIVRQICNANGIPFFYKIKYIHSTYEIVYYVQKDGLKLDGLKLPNPEGTFQNDIQPEESLEVNNIIF